MATLGYMATLVYMATLGYLATLVYLATLGYLATLAIQPLRDSAENTEQLHFSNVRMARSEFNVDAFMEIWKNLELSLRKLTAKARKQKNI